MKTLVLNNDNSYNLLYSNANIDYYNYYSNKMTTIRKIIKRTFPALLPLFFNEWKKNILVYNKVILFDNNYNEVIPKYIKKRNPNCKIYFWYWNKVNDKNVKVLNSKYIDSFYSYDETTAKSII